MSIRYDFMVCWTENGCDKFKCKRYFESMSSATDYLKDKKVRRSFVDMNMLIAPNWYVEIKTKIRLANEIKVKIE